MSVKIDTSCVMMPIGVVTACNLQIHVTIGSHIALRQHVMKHNTKSAFMYIYKAAKSDSRCTNKYQETVYFRVILDLTQGI